jgi:tellurite resistance protein
MEAFPPGERRFVLGHELGHHLFQHHDIPIGLILRGKTRPRPQLALRLFAWSRYAEISADRAGAHCALTPDDVARALFRLASGLTRPLDNLHIAEFADQAEELQVAHETPGPRAATLDWFSTHPFSPLRLKAVRLFLESELALPNGISVSALEARVQELMAVMEPSYLEERSESAEAARRILFAGMIAVADASEGISDEEKTTFEEFFGEGSFSDELDIEGIEASLEERLEEGRRAVSHPRRIQVVRDLCVMARSSGIVASEEKAVILRIAAALDVPPELVNETLSENQAAPCHTERSIRSG